MRTKWIDITDFIDWEGNFTGIQRVEYELAKRFNQENNVRFYYYNPLVNSFAETNFDIINQKAKEVSGELPTDASSSSSLRLLTRIGNKAKSLVPVRAKEPLKRVKKKLQKTSESIPVEPKHPFKDDDVVIVLGGNWGLGTYMPSLKKILNKNKSLKFVHVIYDMIPVMQPGYFPGGLEATFGSYFKHVLESADLCLSISEYSKKDAIKFAKMSNINPPKIEPFRLGDDFVKIKPKKPNINLSNSEFIFVAGTFEIRKNHQLLYYTYKLAKQMGIKLPMLVIAGKKGWLSDSTLHLFNFDPDMKEVEIIHGATDNEMAWLYENCKFSVYPSYYEGWGLPIAESLYYGSYVVASNTSSMPEVAGDLISYFSPYDAKSCLETLLKVNKMSKKDLNIRAKEYKTTSWDDTYKQFSELVNESI